MGLSMITRKTFGFPGLAHLFDQISRWAWRCEVFCTHEIALMLGIHDRFKMTHDMQSNFLAVGNAVSTFHAGIVLAKMIELILDATPSAEMIVKRMLESRMTSDTSVIESFHDATMMSPTS